MRLTIPAIDVRTSVISIGKNDRGELAVPKGENIDKAAWYENSPTPGQTGPSVIEGHIDTRQGPSVFYELAALAPGDSIAVRRQDGSVARFAVQAVRSYSSDEQFPTRLVFGGNLDEATLRLITCSNFDEQTGHYLGNTVVFARLVTVKGL